MTEDEAKAKWCPFVRQPSPSEHPNRGPKFSHQGSTNCNCIGSECMAWRWSSGLVCTATTTQGNRVVKEFNKEIEPQTEGYCGLAK